MSIENTPGRPHTSLEQDLLKLFLNNQSAIQAGESSTESDNNSAHTRLTEELGKLGGRVITVYALHASSRPIVTVHKAAALGERGETYATRNGHIMRGLVDGNKLGIASSKRQAKEITRSAKTTYYTVDVCDSETGEPNVGFIIY